VSVTVILHMGRDGVQTNDHSQAANRTAATCPKYVVSREIVLIPLANMYSLGHNRGSLVVGCRGKRLALVG
jgi:hypothetical protein